MFRKQILLIGLILILSGIFVANLPAVERRTCATMSVMNNLMAENPELKEKMEALEIIHQRIIKETENNENDKVTGTITIPVNVHVIWHTAPENISEAQIQSQIAVMSQDFTRTNTDWDNTPSEFVSLVTNAEIQFTLDNIDRRYSSVAAWDPDTNPEGMKYDSSGGLDTITPTTHLNIWLCNLAGGILGYAYPPGVSRDIDGLVIRPDVFGSETYDTNNDFYLHPQFDLGRTATHEIGHWMNLYHIWGDGGCGVTDRVADTPDAAAANYGCPTHPHPSCDSNDMFMNYMDYTNDACMYMFTDGQKSRMRVLFEPGGARETFVRDGIASAEMAYLQERNIIGDYTSNPNIPAPGDAEVRVHFLVMLVRAIEFVFPNLPYTSSEPYQDVNSGDWFYSDVCKARSWGLIPDYPGPYFEPGEVLKRSEAMLMVKRSMEPEKDMWQLPDPPPNAPNFPDLNGIPNSERLAAWWGLYYNIARGYNGDGTGNFGPNDDIIRDHSAKLVFRLMMIPRDISASTNRDINVNAGQEFDIQWESVDGRYNYQMHRADTDIFTDSSLRYSGQQPSGTVVENSEGTYFYRTRTRFYHANCDPAIVEGGWSEALTVNVNGSTAEADLIPEDPEVNPFQMQPGETVQFRVRVRNIGTGVAPASVIGYYLSDDANWDANDTRLRQDNIGSLQPNYTSIREPYVTMPDDLDGNYILFRVDDGQDVAESNESNNIQAVEIQVNSNEGANLVIESPDVNPWNGVEPGMRMYFSGTVHNIGDTGTLMTSRVGFFLSDDNHWDSGDLLLVTGYFGSILPDGTAEVSRDIPLPANQLPGTYYIIFYVDYQERVPESNEDDNIAAMAIEVTYVQEMTIFTPNDQTVWGRDRDHLIEWASNQGGTVRIELFKSLSLNQLIASNAPNNCSFNWHTPGDLRPEDHYRIKITSNHNASASDMSDYFEIVYSDEVTVIAPNGGEELGYNTSRNISWQGTWNGTANIDLYRNGIFYRQIDTNVPTTSVRPGVYSWLIPDDIPVGSNYLAYVYNTSDAATNDISDATFTISETDPNDPPVAVDDGAVTTRDNPVTIMVLDNDNPPPGSSLQIAGVTQGQNGSVAIDPGNTSVTYTPNSGFIGSDSFEYIVDSGERATVFVTVLDAGTDNDLWARQISGPEGANGNKIAVDSAGNIYVIGSFKGSISSGSSRDVTLTSSGNYDAVIAKYNPSGELQWAQKAGGIARDLGNDIAVDDAGNAYIVGTFDESMSFYNGESVVYTHEQIPGSGWEVFVAKYNSQGVFQWADIGTGIFDDAGKSITIDPANGRLYVGGTFSHAITFGSGAYSTTLNSDDTDLFIVQYTLDGNPIQAEQVSGDGPGSIRSMAVDASGNLYVAGYFNGEAIFGGSITLTEPGDFFIAAFNSAGNALWAQKTHSSYSCEGWGIIVSPTGALYTTGSYGQEIDFYYGNTIVESMTGNNYDFFVARYNPDNGHLVWARKAGGLWYDFGFDIAINSADHPVVTGYFSNIAEFDAGSEPPISVTSDRGSSIFIAEYDQNGELVTIQKSGSGGGAMGIAYDQTGNICLTGSSGNYLTFGQGASFVELSGNDNDIGMFVARLSESTGFPNNPPIAEDDESFTEMDIPVTIPVLENDEDFDGDPLLITDVTQPAHGTAIIDVDGLSIVYTPIAGYYGEDNFDYTISDGNGETADAAVDITVILTSIVNGDELKIFSLDPSSGFGSSVSIHGDYAISGGGSAYIFRHTANGWEQEAKVDIEQPFNIFGESVAIADGHAIVGAYGDNEDGSISGAAYIFSWDGTDWILDNEIDADDNESGDQFSRNAVSVSGDYAIVGSVGDDDASSYSGSAYIFRRNGSTWYQQQKLTASDADYYAFFGNSVSISGEYAVVGAPRHQYRGGKEGAAYVFKFNGQGWEQQAKLIANDREINDNFGQSVSIDGNKIAIGSIGDDDNGENAGAIYIFERVGTTWNQIEKLVTSDYEQGQQIGKSVSISGNRVVAGCAFQLGSVYVFKQTENGWVQERKLTASDGEQGDSFAEDVSVSGNYVISGAYGDDDMGENAGAAYIYDLSEVEQTPTISVTPTSIDFAEITTGECSESQSITIANIGNAPLTVSGQTIDDAQFNIDSGGGSFTLQPGDAHTTEILFCPTSGGEQSAILQINSDDLDNPQVQTELSGTGLEAVESHCDYTVTGSPSTLIITGIEIDGEPLEAGDEVCVYDDDLPVGSVEFEGTYNLPLTAWEGVPSQGLPGYTAGNDISIRIWDSSEQSEITACDLNFAMGDGAFGFAPFSVLSISCNNVVEQCVDLTANQYNMISFNIDPGIVPVCDLFHTGLGNALQIVENGLGGSCAPEFGIDTIGDYIPGQAYRIYISGEDTQLCMEGMHIQDPPAVILEPNRWNWVGYTCPTPVPVEHVFSSIDCIDMVRDNNGNAWVPAWNVNSIGDMSLGSGYEVFITCSDPVEFIANCTVGRELASASIIDLPIPNPSSNSGDESSVNPTTYDLSCFTYTQTGLAYTLIFSDITIDGEPIEAGDEIAVFDDDLTVGGGVFDGDFNYAFSVWQADSLFDMPGFQSGNPMSFKIFDQSSNQILDATPAYIVGSGAFGDSIYTVLSLAAFSPTELPACLAYGIHDEGRNDSQFFTIDLNNNNQIDLLGDMHDDYDIEGIEIHPASGVIFATAGSDNEHDLDGFLFTVDAETGELNPIGYTGYSEIVGLSFRPSDNTLWGWSEGYGLIFINIGDGSATLEFESNRNMEGLAWNNEGTTLYASMNRELWTYHPGDDAMIQIDENLPGVTEALEMRRDGYLMGSTDQVDNLTIFAYDVEIMQVVATEEIVTDYNDIESLAWPDWCDWDIRTRCIDIYANRYNYISFGWELTNPAVENVFSQLDSLLVVTSNDGGTYIPGNINTIGDVTPGEVYRLFISGENASLCVNGNSLALPIPPVLQPNQWNWVASTCQDLVLVEDFFSEILDDIVIVTDDNNGLVFIPNLVNTIEYIMPNVGYKVYTTLGGVASFGYDCPGNAAVAGMSELTDAPMSEHFTFTRTGQSYTIVVTEAQLSDHSLEACAEIGVFDRNLCVGSVIVTGENFPLVIPVWQGSTEPDLPGYADSYPISFRVWQDDQITELEAEFEHGDGTFGNDLFTKVSLCGDPFISKEETLLRQNYPNPFNPVTVIRYTLAESGEATLQVYSSAGRLVRTLSSGLQESGEHSATWDGQNDRGQKVATGVYFYRLQAHEGKFDQTRKMILMK